MFPSCTSPVLTPRGLLQGVAMSTVKSHKADDITVHLIMMKTHLLTQLPFILIRYNVFVLVYLRNYMGEL